MLVPLCLFVALVGVTAEEFDDENYWLLPRLFELDNYEECLSHPNGLYCLGSFHLTPAEDPNPLYDLIKNYSKDPQTFNRTLIHRGYCVSACSPNSTGDAVQRFSNCAEDWARPHRLHAKLHELQYCKEHQSVNATRDIGWPEVAFLIVIALIIVLNAAGTAYEYTSRDKEKKISLLTMWSVIDNWKLLIEIDTKSSSILRPIEGFRFMMAFCASIVHFILLYYTLFLYDPRSLERLLRSPYLMPILNSTSILQIFIVVSCYVCAFSLLRTPENLSIGTLFKVILQRVFRLSPAYILVVAFASTWLPWFGDGPFWSTHITTQSDICREKFWAHALFINNLVKPDSICLLPTWYMAVDLQMYVLSAIITITLVKLSKKALPILVVLFIASVLLNAVLPYKFGWKPFLYIARIPELLHNVFQHIPPSWSRFHMSSWSNLPACFLGLIVGHILHYAVDKKTIFKKYKWLIFSVGIVSSISMLCWLMMGNYFIHKQDPLFMAAFGAIERSIVLIVCLFSFGTFGVIDSSFVKIFSWEVWQPLARLSQSVMQLHWCVGLIIIASSPQPLVSSPGYVITIGIAVTFITYLVALPLTLFLVMPMNRTSNLIFQ